MELTRHGAAGDDAPVESDRVEDGVERLATDVVKAARAGVSPSVHTIASSTFDRYPST